MIVSNIIFEIFQKVKQLTSKGKTNDCTNIKIRNCGGILKLNSRKMRNYMQCFLNAFHAMEHLKNFAGRVGCSESTIHRELEAPQI